MGQLDSWLWRSLLATLAPPIGVAASLGGLYALARAGKARLGKYQRYLRSNLWRSQDWGAAGVYPRIVVVGQAGDAPSGLTVRQVQTSLRAAVMGGPD